MAAFDYRQAEEIRDAFQTHQVKYRTALRELGFQLTEQQAQEVRRGKAFIQLKNGPFDLDLVFAPDGLERFEEPWERRVEISGFPVPTV